MSARNLFRRLMTRSLRTPTAAPVRKRPPVLGRRFEVLEDRSVPAATIAYITGHGLDSTSLAGAGLTVVPNTAGYPASDAGFASAFGAGGFDALVIGEDVGTGIDLSAATKTNIANYASGGGTVIVLGSQGNQATFLNSVFGFSTASGGLQYGNEPVTRVAGTGPATLAAMSGTAYITGAPGLVTYTGNGGETAAFTSNYGSGYVDFLAWDFCCGPPAQFADWYSVLAADITVGSLTAALDGAGNLVITDSTGVANNLTVSVGGSSLVITDAAEQFQAAPAGGTLSNGNKTLTIPFSSIAGSQVIFNTGGGNDTLTESFAGGNFAKQIAFNGGGNFDTLAFQGGSFAAATFNYTNSTDGSVTYGTNSTAYTGLAPITSSVTATNVTLNYGVSAETITVTDAGGGQTNVSSTAGETTTFPNPTGSLTINAGDGNDVVNVTSFGAGFNAALTIDGQNNTDTINVNTALNLSAGGGTLTLTGEAINLNGGTVTTTGAQTYNGAVRLGAGTTLTSSGGGNVTFAGAVDAAHYFQFVGAPATFATAQANAAGMTLNGFTGYLATITSAAENALAQAATGGNAFTWLGGSDAAVEGTWRWTGGPENGLQFSQGGTAVNGQYTNWAGGEPNNSSGNENALGILSNGLWNDGGDFNPAQYLVEFGVPQALTVNTTGTTTFGGAVGALWALTSVSTDAPGTTTLNGGAVTTTGAQIYGDAVTLGAGTTLTSNASGNVTFAAAVNGAFALAVNTAGTTTFGGAVGGTTALASLATDAGGSTAINGGSVATTGNQTYGDNVTLGAATALTATAAGTVTFGGTTTGGVPLTVTTNTGNVVINGAMTIGGNVVLTTRRPMINAPLNVGANNLTIQSPIGGYEIGGFVGADGLSGPDLANITVGGTFNLGNLTTQLGINSNGTIYPVVFPASISGPVNVRAYGFVNFINGPTSFAGPGTVTVTTTGGSGNVSVNHSTPVASLTTAGPLVVNAAGQFFVGSNGAGPATVTAPSLTATAASAQFDGNVNVTGAASVAATTSTITGAGLLTAGTSATLTAVSGIGTAGTPLRVNTPTFANVQTATGGIYVNIWDTVNVPHTVTSASATVSGDVVFVSTNGGGTNTNAFSSVTAANGNVDLSRTTAGNITLGNVTASTAGRTITATVQGPQNGINHTSGTVQTAGGAITLIADQMNLVGGTITATPAGSVTLRPWTNNQPIDLGATPANTLGLTDPALDTITANVLQIGNASSGVVTVSGPITPAAAANLSVTNGTDLAVNANVTTAGSIAFAFGQGGAGTAATLSGNLAGTSATVTGGGGTDSITVNTVASSPVLTLNGAGAADAYTVNHGAWTGTVAIADTGASGTDAATLYGTAAANTFNVNTAAAQTVRFGSPATEFVTYTANLETLTVNGQPTPDAPQAPVVSDAGDTFTVTPDAATAITINGGQPVNGTGDTLVLNAAPLTAPIAITNQSGGQPALPNGRITSGNRQAVLWNSIETLPVPLGLGGTFDFQPAGSTTQGGFLPVTPADSAAGGAYSAAQVGWVNPGSGAFDRPLVYGPDGVPNSPRLAGLLQDGEWGYAGGGGNNGLFQVAVAPGALPDRLVQVTVFSGDTYAPRDSTNVYVRNLTTGARTKLNPTLATLSTAGQTYQYVSYSGMIDPGSAATPGSTKVLLQVEFEAVYGWSSSFWTVSGVDVRPLGLIAPLTLTRAGGNGAQPGDGVTVDTYTGTGAAPFAELTVSPQLGTVTTADADAAFSGIQVVADASGNFAFDV
ncbi:MAG: hypothetical protein K2P78_09105, partial [Gemmataceae bacterium]|nr:hypothetical protein [Gemmataceae bacterium]